MPRFVSSLTLIVAAPCVLIAAEGPVRPIDLENLIAKANKIVVRSGPHPDATTLYSSTKLDDLRSFAAAAKVDSPPRPFVCRCLGTVVVELYAGDTRLVTISNHHSKHIRCSLWESDAPLSDSEKWLAWFDARGIDEPRREADENKRQDFEAASAEKKWYLAMPRSLRLVWDRATRNALEPNMRMLRTPLLAEFPDARRRALVLFAWYGSGMGPWSGYPAYEDVAEKLLLEIPIAELVTAAETEQLTEAQMEGAARFFGGWIYSQLPESRKLPLSPELKRKLLEHSLKSTNEDKRGRAETAFGN